MSVNPRTKKLSWVNNLTIAVALLQIQSCLATSFMANKSWLNRPTLFKYFRDFDIFHNFHIKKMLQHKWLPHPRPPGSKVLLSYYAVLHLFDWPWLSEYTLVGYNLKLALSFNFEIVMKWNQQMVLFSIWRFNAIYWNIP